MEGNDTADVDVKALPPPENSALKRPVNYPSGTENENGSDKEEEETDEVIENGALEGQVSFLQISLKGWPVQVVP